jgi:hypothetical protein
MCHRPTASSHSSMLCYAGVDSDRYRSPQRWYQHDKQGVPPDHCRRLASRGHTKLLSEPIDSLRVSLALSCACQAARAFACTHCGTHPMTTIHARTRAHPPTHPHPPTPTHPHTHTHTHTVTHTHTHTCTHVRTYARTHAHTHDSFTYTAVHHTLPYTSAMFGHVCVCVCVCVCLEPPAAQF